MRYCALALLLAAGLAKAEEPADAETTINFLAASEFAGLGAGVEVGGKWRLVAGVGTGLAVNFDGEHWSVQPGAGLGFRRYIRNWYLGPTLGAGYRINSDSEFIHHGEDGWRTWALLDLGYRWRWDDNPDWSTKLGIAPGVGWDLSEETIQPALGFTLSVGFNL